MRGPLNRPRCEKLLIFFPWFWQLSIRMSLKSGSKQVIQAFDLQGYLAQRTAAVDRALHSFLPPASAKPATIHKAMRYSIFAGGKRLRPALCLAAAEACTNRRGGGASYKTSFR